MTLVLTFILFLPTIIRAVRRLPRFGDTVLINVVSLVAIGTIILSPVGLYMWMAILVSACSE
jgi:hypothetical protein